METGKGDREQLDVAPSQGAGVRGRRPGRRGCGQSLLVVRGGGETFPKEQIRVWGTWIVEHHGGGRDTV